MILGLIFSWVFGSIIGSFLNVLILRLPEEETMSGRSHCAKCKHELSALDLIPVVSYLFLRGECRYCKKSISRRYIYIEIITGLLFSLCFARIYPLSVYEYTIFFRDIFVCALMVVVFMIDYEHFLILDKVVIWGAGVLLVINAVIDFIQRVPLSQSQTVNGLLAASGLYLFFGAIYYFSKGRWMGYGDVKFAWVLGLAIPFPTIFVAVFLSFILGSIVGILLLTLGNKKLNSEVPFGTFLTVASVVALLYGQSIIKWYFHLIGIRYYL